MIINLCTMEAKSWNTTVSGLNSLDWVRFTEYKEFLCACHRMCKCKKCLFFLKQWTSSLVHLLCRFFKMRSWLNVWLGFNKLSSRGLKLPIKYIHVIQPMLFYTVSSFTIVSLHIGGSFRCGRMKMNERMKDP